MSSTETSSLATGRAFEEFDLPDLLRKGIRDAGFTNCTPIQDASLPIALAGRDVAGQAQTGTGKTAAFLITIFKRLLEHERTGGKSAPRALVIAPTRELAVQIADDAYELGQHTPFLVRAVYGGVDYRKQREDLEKGVDVLIGTPGRLIDYFKQHVYDLGHVEVLVIDEADRMFDMGFIRDLRYLLRRLPTADKRQSMLFSATLSYDVTELAYTFMNEAEKVAIKPEQVTAEKVEHLVYHVGKEEKIPLFLNLLRKNPDARVLVFVNMRRTAEDIEAYLEANGFVGRALTGDVDQRKRLRILDDFKSDKLSILVATDVASRGLHIDRVTHVVNYDVPLDPEDYVHRVGRTARAGASGVAYTLACEGYVQGLEPIEAYIGFKLPHEFPDESLLAGDVKRPAFRRRRRPPGPGRGPGGGPGGGRGRPRAGMGKPGSGGPRRKSESGGKGTSTPPRPPRPRKRGGTSSSTRSS